VIAIVMPLGELRGGVERMLLNLLRANRLNPKAHYQVCFLEDGPLVGDVRRLGVAATVVESGRLREPVRYVRTVRAIRRWLRDIDAEAVVSWAAKGHLYAGPAALTLRVPSAWYVHSLPDGHWMDRLVTALPADVVLCCGASAEAAQRRIWPRRTTRTVYIAVDLNMFHAEALGSPADARRQLGLPRDGPLVTLVGRLQRWKGIHVFVDAGATVSEAFPDATFVVVGGDHWAEPAYPAELERQADELGLSERLHFVGLQSNVPLWMQAADVLVHASFDEPTGTVILEGMALGKPVVAARTAGPMEFVDEGATGLLATAGDAAELAQRIGELLADPELAARIGTAARVSASRFGIDRLSSDLAEAMNVVIERRRAR